MNKDPAFLFYSSDFLTGTMLMSDEQVGKYIRLLCVQHQKGHLTEKDMLKICITHDEDIFNKFSVDAAGKYFNSRLEAEINKRSAYSESRRANRLGKSKDMNNICKSHDAHMENENINENINTNIKETKEKKHKYGEYKNVLLTDSEIEKLKEKFSDWQLKIDTLSEGMELKGYKYKSHYLAILKWARSDKQDKPTGKPPEDRWANVTETI
jgi:hypothetical protein